MNWNLQFLRHAKNKDMGTKEMIKILLAPMGQIRSRQAGCYFNVSASPF